VGLTHVREQKLEHFFQPYATPGDAQRGNANAFLIDVLGASGKTAGDHAADVLPVRHDTDEGERALAAKYRIEETDVVQVRAAGVRIIVQVEIAGPDVVTVLGDQCARRPRERRDVGRLL